MARFKDKPLEERKKFAQSILAKYPDKFPVIIESNKDTDLPMHKFIVPQDLTVGQLLYMIRKRTKLASEEALYVFFKNSLLNTNTLMTEVYRDYKDLDGILYGMYAKENTFGGLC